ncbi:immunoglobulin superfamily containing leucine-rich repeat protein 2 [Leopardus geoffroyi]|uniref:immunoglobulin superfamily containing leucine-rich repeat protein 2 n=1 Tax=Leopardus geoffroyi TaxID=46844 RepID=UPI001E25FBE0|nr:immunoglobulin superfamily containing leucine-rich repeat protein 2 [Leopardus geoffroyi]XP_045305067.1 immunoglobulin superfamily containing leucine-rich repeat protein 2 [Leopardus geoffroyi]XP_045305068.1 immunoglobulin superfamily containing leucine-rich repeat protein 2 [Leopardus geoffroyi]XP_045305069.1 immunoglobulin superfamily containing leucine-rich repeat protein 2 [Leopardus geoffroyi]XP_045305070.1 immunoglobulin superfamily containing leucine-rich repeat protein 2 [Leopardus g
MWKAPLGNRLGAETSVWRRGCSPRAARRESAAGSAMVRLRALWLAWALLGGAAACPEPCACVDKYAHQFADCAYKELREVPEGLPANVTTLSLSANKITVLRRGAFADVTQVTSLWLAHNEVRTVEPGALAVLSQLKNLDLSHNLISSFPWSDLRNLSALQLLKMNHNRLGSLPRDALGALPDLRSLRINNNRLRTLAPGTFDALSALSHLQLYHNPFHCGCSLVWLQAWAASTRVSLPEPDSIACASPPALQGVPVHRLPALSCAPPSVRLSAEPPPEAPDSPWPAGLALLLHCFAEGHPTPRLQWQLQIPGGTVVLEPPVQSGEDYADGAEDGEEEGDGDGPTQTEAPIPTPAPAWPAPPANPRFLALTNGSLLVPLLSAKEAGVYTCRAYNELGANSTSLRVAVAASGPPKHAPGSGGDSDGQAPTSERKSTAKGRGNSVLPSKPEGKIKGPGLVRVSILGETEAGPEEEEAGEGEEAEDQVSADPVEEQRCGHGDPSRYVSNHAFNQSAELKQHVFELGVIALDVAEREARVQLTPLAARWGSGPSGAGGAGRPGRRPLRLLYLCPAGGGAAVQWSRVEEGVNAYWFRGLRPGTNYSVCLALAGEACHVQVVFATKKELPSLLVIVAVSVFLLVLATVPLLGAACCHLLAKHPGKPYRLILRPQAPDPMEKRIAADFDPRASYLESEKSYQAGGEADVVEPEEAPGEGLDEDAEQGDPGGDLQREESLAACSLVESQSKANQEEFEAGSEYSDRLPLGAEAVNIAQEINGNYRQTAG